jgi:hypothetical protein
MSSDEQENIKGSLLAIQRPKRSHKDDFVSSMTFATNHNKTFQDYGLDNPCDCGDDECAAIVRGVPTEIAEAVRTYKQLRKDHPYYPSFVGNSPDDAAHHPFAIPLNFHPNKPRQERLLLASSSNIKVWKLTMPTDAEPLIESGGTHRIVYVKHLPKSSNIISIGRGIYGSSMEEKGRVRMKWTKGGWYLLPSNGGISLGWIHKYSTESSNDETSLHDEGNTDNGPTQDSTTIRIDDAVVLVIKLSPPSATEDDGEEEVNDKLGQKNCMTKTFFNVLKSYLTMIKSIIDKQPTSISNFEEELGRQGGIEISNQDHAQLLNALQNFLPPPNEIF